MNKTRPFLHTILSIKDSLEQQVHYNGNIFGNKCCHYNEGSLCCMVDCYSIVVTHSYFSSIILVFFPALVA